MLEHADIYMEMLVDIGFGYNRIVSLLDNPGFYNLLYSTSFTNLLRRFPLEHLSGYALEVLVHITTDSGMLEEFANGDLVPFLVDLLEKKLEQINSLEEHNKSVCTHQLSPSSRPHEPTSLQPGLSLSQQPTAAQPMTSRPTFTLTHSVPLTDDGSAIPYSSAIPSERPPQPTMDTHPGFTPIYPRKSCALQPHTSPAQGSLLLQLEQPSITPPVSPTSCHVNNSGFHPSSAIKSQVSRCTIGHVSPSSKSLPPNETSSFRVTLDQTNELTLRSQPVLSKVNYKTHSGTIQRSPQLGVQQNILDSQGHFLGGMDQYDNHPRGIHHNSPSYLYRTPHFTMKSTLSPSASIPEQSAIPTLQTPCHSPHSIQGSAFLAVENTLDLASPANDNRKKTAQGRVKEPVDMGKLPSAIGNNAETVALVEFSTHNLEAGLHPQSNPPWLSSRYFSTSSSLGPSQTTFSSPTSVTRDISDSDGSDQEVNGTENKDSPFLGNHRHHRNDLRQTGYGFADHPRAEDNSPPVLEAYGVDQSQGEPDGYNSSDPSHRAYEDEAFLEDGVDQGFEDNNRVNDNGEFVAHFGNEKPLLDDNNSIGFQFDNQASQRSDELSIQPEDSTHLEIEEPGDNSLFFESEDEFEDFNDSASQRSEDWSIPLDEGVEQNNSDLYEDDQPIRDDDGASQRSDDWGPFFEDEADEVFEEGNDYDQYDNNREQDEYGSDEESYHCLALVSQTFPRSLWSLQLPKPTHIRSPELNVPSKPNGTLSVNSPLLETLASHVPFFDILPVFESFFHTAGVVFLRNLQLSRRFVSTLEGTDIVIKYREHLLLPGDDESNSEIWDEEIEVTHDAMDELFGVGPTSIFNSTSEAVAAAVTEDLHPTVGLSSHEEQYEGWNGRDFTNPNLLGEWRSVEPYRYDESQLNNYGNDKCKRYLALIPSSFPSTLLYLQSPKTRNQLQSRTTDLSLLHDTVHIPVLAALSPLVHTLQLFGTAWARSPPSFRTDWAGMLDEEAVLSTVSNRDQEDKAQANVPMGHNHAIPINDGHRRVFATLASLDWVGMIDEEALTKTASDQHLKRPPISEHNEPGHLSAYHNLLRGLEMTGSRSHNDNLAASLVHLVPAHIPLMVQNLQLSRHVVSRPDPTNFIINNRERNPLINKDQHGNRDTNYPLVNVPFDIPLLPTQVTIWRQQIIIRRTLLFNQIPLSLTLSRFVPSHQLSRRFVSSIEGINVVSDYRENLLLPIEYSKPDSEFGEGEIEWDVPWAPSPFGYLFLCRTFQPWSSFSLNLPLMHAVVSIRIVHGPVHLGFSHTDQRSSPPPNFAVTYDGQLGDKLGGNGTPLSSRDTSNPLTSLEIKLVQILFVTFVVRDLLNEDSGPQMVLDKSLLVLVNNKKVTLELDNALFSGEHTPSILCSINVSSSNRLHVAPHLHLPIVDFPQVPGYSNCENSADSSKEIDKQTKLSPRPPNCSTATEQKIYGKDVGLQVLYWDKEGSREPKGTGDNYDDGAHPSMPVNPRHSGRSPSIRVQQLSINPITIEFEFPLQFPRQDSTVLQRKNWRLNGGVKTRSLTSAAAHFFLVTLADTVTDNPRQISPSLLETLSPCLPFQISIEDACFQNEQPWRRSSPCFSFIDQSPLIPSSSALRSPAPQSQLPSARSQSSNPRLYPPFCYRNLPEDRQPPSAREYGINSPRAAASQLISTIPHLQLPSLSIRDPADPLYQLRHHPVLDEGAVIRTASSQPRKRNEISDIPVTKFVPISGVRPAIPYLSTNYTVTSLHPSGLDSQRLVVRIALVLTVSSYAGFYQHPRHGKAVTTTVNHRSDEREEVKHNVPMHPHTPNRRNLGQILPFSFASRPHRRLSPLADLNTKSVQYNTTSRQRSSQHSRSYAGASNDLPTRIFPTRSFPISQSPTSPPFGTHLTDASRNKKSDVPASKRTLPSRLCHHTTSLSTNLVASTISFLSSPSTAQLPTNSPFHTSSTHIGVVITLQTFTFGIESGESASPIVTTAQMNHNARNKDNRDCLPHIQRADSTNPLEQQYSIFREVFTTILTACQRELPPSVISRFIHPDPSRSNSRKLVTPLFQTNLLMPLDSLAINLPYPSHFAFQHIVSPTTLVLVVTPCAEFCQRLEPDEAVEEIASNPYDRRGEELKHGILGIPNPFTHLRLRQTLRFGSSSFSGPTCSQLMVLVRIVRVQLVAYRCDTRTNPSSPTNIIISYNGQRSRNCNRTLNDSPVICRISLAAMPLTSPTIFCVNDLPGTTRHDLILEAIVEIRHPAPLFLSFSQSALLLLHQLDTLSPKSPTQIAIYDVHSQADPSRQSPSPMSTIRDLPTTSEATCFSYHSPLINRCNGHKKDDNDGCSISCIVGSDFRCSQCPVHVKGLTIGIAAWSFIPPPTYLVPILSFPTMTLGPIMFHTLSIKPTRRHRFGNSSVTPCSERPLLLDEEAVKNAASNQYCRLNGHEYCDVPSRSAARKSLLDSSRPRKRNLPKTKIGIFIRPSMGTICLSVGRTVNIVDGSGGCIRVGPTLEAAPNETRARSLWFGRDCVQEGWLSLKTERREAHNIPRLSMAHNYDPRLDHDSSRPFTVWFHLCPSSYLLFQTPCLGCCTTLVLFVCSTYGPNARIQTLFPSQHFYIHILRDSVNKNGKAYVMNTRGSSLVIEVHFVGSHATSGPVLHQQLFYTPPETLVQGSRPENSQSGPPGMVFQCYKLERVQAQHMSHSYTLISAF
ncbi:hypothetical protein PQX77_021812 [Marasmius sp. AFHP31]|nr:hypothetical protein PQX77_021812 [Marasmius sp. AFHP31]